MTFGYEALEDMFRQADPVDIAEGKLAYSRYHVVMQRLADHYDVPLDRVVAAFCALSPNSDYRGNLRSLVSVLDGHRRNWSVHQVQVATYRHCLMRAWMYVKGTADFMQHTKGLKIRAFYTNVLNPDDDTRATIDGHMSAIWHNQPQWTMKEAIIRPATYREIEYDVKRLAFWHQMLPHQMQAILWFTRKRTRAIVYDPQMQLFTAKDDLWQTLQHPADIHPYPERPWNGWKP